MTYSHPDIAASQARHYSVAVLGADQLQNQAVAFLSFDLTASDDGWHQILPAGHFSAVDGRPHDVPGGKWYIDGEIAARLIAVATSAKNDVVVDYEHQTLLTEKNGQPAPASAWFHGAEMQWREDSGLWIKPRWTKRAQEYIDNGEYKYLSSVFPYDKKTGIPLYIHSVGLTNRAGLDGMEPLTNLTAADLNPSASLEHKTPEQEQPMNEIIIAILKALGIDIEKGKDPTDDQLKTAQAALTAMIEKSGKVDGLETEVAALKAGNGNGEVNLSEYVPAATYNALVTEMATLKAGSDTDTAERLIDDARKQGKVMAKEEDYLNSFAKQQGVAALKAMLESRPVIANLQQQQGDTRQQQQEQNRGEVTLTAEDKAVLKATGMTAEEFLKSKKDIYGTAE
jgi:phage I-like protein